jgi:hypothetical protein
MQAAHQHLRENPQDEQALRASTLALLRAQQSILEQQQARLQLLEDANQEAERKIRSQKRRLLEEEAEKRQQEGLNLLLGNVRAQRVNPTQASQPLRLNSNRRDAPELYAKLMGAGSPSAYVKQWKWRDLQRKQEAKLLAKTIELEVEQFGEEALLKHEGLEFLLRWLSAVIYADYSGRWDLASGLLETPEGDLDICVVPRTLHQARKAYSMKKKIKRDKYSDNSSNDEVTSTSSASSLSSVRRRKKLNRKSNYNKKKQQRVHRNTVSTSSEGTLVVVAKEDGTKRVSHTKGGKRGGRRFQK